MKMYVLFGTFLDLPNLYECRHVALSVVHVGKNKLQLQALKTNSKSWEVSDLCESCLHQCQHVQILTFVEL